MGANSIRQFNLDILSTFFGVKNRFGAGNRRAIRLNAKSIWDSYSSSASTTRTMQGIVRKMQNALGASNASAAFAWSTNGSASTRAGQSPLEVHLPEATDEDIGRAVKDAGGYEALSRWTIDGKTKIQVNGHKVVAKVAEPEASSADSDPRAAMEKSLSRFGLSFSILEKSPDHVREQLKSAAAAAQKNEPKLALAIEYALEDAYAKLSAYENWRKGSPDQAAAYENQRVANQQQADSIAGQLNLGDGTAWGIQSLGEDLAVFGMDFADLKGDAYDIAETIRQKSKDMLTDLDSRYVGTETEYYRERNRITGASARLVNGIEGAAALSSANSASFSIAGQFSFSTQPTSVNVGGAKVDAGFIIGVGNVIVDPLVLDLAGDGIDLSAAEEGVMFDMDGDGQQAATGFVRGDDAFLFVDTHGDGVVHDGRQLFGNQDGHANGFEMLRQYDENGDGVIDENDAIYDKLMVWQEKTEDGVCEEDETMTLREAGIASISLDYENVREDDGKGNLVSQNGSFTRDDGSEGYAADVWLRENRGITL